MTIASASAAYIEAVAVAAAAAAQRHYRCHRYQRISWVLSRHPQPGSGHWRRVLHGSAAATCTGMSLSSSAWCQKAASYHLPVIPSVSPLVLAFAPLKLRTKIPLPLVSINKRCLLSQEGGRADGMLRLGLREAEGPISLLECKYAGS